MWKNQARPDRCWVRTGAIHVPLLFGSLLLALISGFVAACSGAARVVPGPDGPHCEATRCVATEDRERCTSIPSVPGDPGDPFSGGTVCQDDSSCTQYADVPVPDAECDPNSEGFHRVIRNGAYLCMQFECTNWEGEYYNRGISTPTGEIIDVSADTRECTEMRKTPVDDHHCGS